MILLGWLLYTFFHLRILNFRWAIDCINILLELDIRRTTLSIEKMLQIVFKILISSWENVLLLLCLVLFVLFLRIYWAQVDIWLWLHTLVRRIDRAFLRYRIGLILINNILHVNLNWSSRPFVYVRIHALNSFYFWLFLGVLHNKLFVLDGRLDRFLTLNHGHLWHRVSCAIIIAYLFSQVIDLSTEVTILHDIDQMLHSLDITILRFYSLNFLLKFLKFWFNKFDLLWLSGSCFYVHSI